MGVMRLKEHKPSVAFAVDADCACNTTTDSRLSVIILNDLLYGVGQRHTLPSVFDDESDLDKEFVDPLSDMRHDSWHDASVAMNPQFNRTEQTIEVGSQVETTDTDDTPKDE